MTLRVSIIQKNKSKGIKTWYARIADPEAGIEVYRSLKTTLKGEAQYMAAQALEDFKHETIDVTFEKAFQELIRYKELHGCAKSTMYMFNSAFDMLYSLRNRKLDTIKPEEIAAIFEEKCSEYKPGTYNIRHKYCTVIFSYFVDREWIARNPMKKVPKKKTVRDKFPFFWTMDQVNAILDNAPSSDYRITWALMAFAGLRREEVKGLDSSDLYDGHIHLIGKGNKMATIPISSRLRAELDRYGRSLPKLDSRTRAVKKAAELAKIEFQGEATNHRFRHSFASNLIRAGADIKSVQLLMRHESIQITLDTYSHLLGADLESAVNRIG